METTKEQREELKQHMEWMACRHDRHTANKYFLAILDDLEAAEAEIAKLREQTQWRPIDMAPKERCTKMLLYDSGVEIGWWDGVWIGLDGYRIEPTYCMPLPLSPQAQESERK